MKRRTVSGLPTPGAAAYWALKRLKAGAKVALVLPKLSEVEEVSESCAALAPLVGVEAARPAVFTEDPVSSTTGLERLAAGARLALIQAEALARPMPSRESWSVERLPLRIGTVVHRVDLLNRLERLGFRREDFADTPGDYAVRGSVTDFCLPQDPDGVASPNVRVFWDDDRVVSIRAFDPSTHRTIDGLDAIELAPLAPEGTADLPAWTSGFEWLSLAGEAQGLPEEAKVVASSGDEDFGARSNPRFQGSLPAAGRQAKTWLANGWTVVLYSLTRGEDERLRETLGDALAGVQCVVGPLTRGFHHEGRRLAVLTSGEIFERSYRARSRWGASADAARARWRDLKVGDYVVHGDYGIARYLGLRPVTAPPPPGLTASQLVGTDAPPVQQELILLEFRAGDKLFVPLWEFRKVQKYVSASGKAPRLSSIDTAGWELQKTKAREGAVLLAKQLLKLEAARAAAKGAAFGPETHLEREFADSFPYEETPDQARTIGEVVRDLEAPRPMNRLVIGDVGFGKTEIAMRAALKCVVAGRQAVVLVPTTILADQHRRNFERRLAEYPVRVASLSRFQTKDEQKDVLAGLASGRIDVVIGTHRLLQKDVKVKSLGLIVVDEEHRFGVSDKEKLKKLAATTHYLALSATPIPRSLYQTLSGLRELSLVASPPAGRLPIATRVEPITDDAVAGAIRAELERDGQVYYVHNRVRGLAERKKELEKLVPGARFVLAHGQMSADQLETAMWEFHGRKYDVLVSSTIIESGLDIPGVNTLIVENAHEFGLAQLYQLRGRIGRESERAFCWLLHPNERLTEEAQQRLDALKEFAHLGSGFQLAMRDLEIRGAGELLGARQHGFVNAIGLEAYCELLKEEVDRLKGRPSVELQAGPTLDFKLAAYLPPTYLTDDMQRLDMYKRILGAKSDELDKIRYELDDLAGPPPAPVVNLLAVAHLRIEAEKAGIRSIAERDGSLDIRFRPGAAVDPELVARWAAEYAGKLSFVASEEGDGLRLAIDRPAIPATEAFLSSFRRK